MSWKAVFENPADRHGAYRAWVAADEAWSRELRRVYGKRAGDARYDKRGTATPELRRLHAAWVAAGQRRENPMEFTLKSAFQPAGFAPGDKVYWDSMSGLVPAVVLEDFPARKEVRIRLTGTRGPWRKGEEQVLSHRSVVFRDQVRTTRMGQYRIGPRRLR